MTNLVADTHAVIWYLSEPEKLSPDAVAALDGATQSGGLVFVPSICLVEAGYLMEKGKVPLASFRQLSGIFSDPATGFAVAPLDLAVAQAVRQIPRASVPEMPDRIIAATAFHMGLPPVTRDRKIRASGIATIW